ncbi:MAG: potassium channel family protein [Solirubrobacterales bacterium]
MKKIVVEYVENDEKIYWISERKISNKHKGRIYPTQTSDVADSKTVAVYYINEHNEKKQIAKLACVDYDLLKQKYEAGEFINLNYTYIDDFSWCGSKKFYEIDENIYRNIQGFSAYCSFWNAENLSDKLVNLIQLNIISEDVCFDYSIFYKTVFSLTNVNILKGSLYFDNTKFMHVDLSLMGIGCNKNLYDNPTISMNYTEFNNSTVELFMLKDNMDIDFMMSRMTGTKVEINNTRSPVGIINIANSKLDKFIASYCKIGGIDAVECEATSLIFNECEFNGLSEIELRTDYEIAFITCLINSILKIQLEGTPDKISFDSTINNGRIYFRNFKNFIEPVINSVKENGDINQLLMLKENFRTLGEYENEDVCYSQSRKMENELNVKNVFKKVRNHLTYLISDYGTKPLRLFIFILTLIFSFSFLYYICPFIMFEHAVNFIDYFYVSGITFFTVGYGDILPLNSISKIVVLIEAFMGFTSMSYFLIVLSRKIIR